MVYFAGVDISMAETPVCVMAQSGAVITNRRCRRRRRISRVSWRNSQPADGSYSRPDEWRQCSTTVCANSDWWLSALRAGRPIRALKLLATHKTDHNDARALAHLARTGFFKRMHVKSLPAHAVQSLVIVRKKLAGRRLNLADVPGRA